MSEYLIQEETLQGIGDKIRVLSGTEGAMTPAEMQSGVQAAIDREDGFIVKNISGEYSNNRVSCVGYYAFYTCGSLTSVNFPKVTTIYTSAFCNCYRLTSVSFPVATTIHSGAFYNCSSLTSVNFPKVATIQASAFYSCGSLTSVSFPVATTIHSSAFYKCSSLTSVNFPKVATIHSSAFYNCSSLTSVSFPVATTIHSGAFYSCRKLVSLTLGADIVCTLNHSAAFSYTPIGGYSDIAGCYGSIYVPACLLDSYKTATNWSYFASRFVADESLGNGNGNHITFTINGTTYYAVEGMTWSEWCASSYNTGGYMVNGSNIWNSSWKKIYDSDGVAVTTSTVIISGYAYTV